MQPLTLHSERYRPEGNIDAWTARRAIGRPNLDFWSLFLRETLQNSWDARLPTATSIDFRVDGFFATAEQIAILREMVFKSEPDEFGIDDLLDGGELPILVVSDSKTTGLQGPTRADLSTSEPTHFVDFVRNIGRSEDKAMGGGTYGFGKGVLYDASICRTILVFTRTTARGRPVTRLIGVGLGTPFDSGEHRYTGRHWWGVPDASTGAEPLTGDDAETLASSLGIYLPKGEYGTAIAILGPVATDSDGEETLTSIVDRIAAAATHWAWPHMVGRGSGATVNFTFRCDDEGIDPPSPITHPVYKHYVGAYRRANAIVLNREPAASWPWQDHELSSGRPKLRLGALVFRTVPREQLSKANEQGDPINAIALMREPRLVVKYLDAPINPDGNASMGVFVADADLDRQFALSEPVAHDDWSPENLRGAPRQFNPVRQTLDKIRKALRPSPSISPQGSSTGRFSGVVRLASTLGDLLEGKGPSIDPRIDPPSGPTSGGGGGSADGDEGEGKRRPRPGGQRRRSEPRAALVGSPRLTTWQGDLAAVFDVDAFVPEGKVIEIIGEARVLLDGGAAESSDEAPLGAAVPRVIGWTAEGATPDPGTDGAKLRIADPGDHRIQIWVLQPPDVAVTVSVRVNENSR